MTDVIQFLLIGLGLGGVYGLAALGLVLVYRGTGVVNFAHGGIALIAATAFVDLRGPLGTWPAVAVGLLTGAAIGAGIELLVMRRLAHAATLTRTVATIALLALAQELVMVTKGQGPVFVSPILPQGTIDFGGEVTLGADRAILVALLAVTTVGLALLLSRTRAGLSLTATAENRRAASALGHDPHRVALATWMAGGLLAAAAGIFIAPLTSLSPATTPLIIIPALAAALVGRMHSLPGALVGALVVGIAEAEATRYITAPGWAGSVPFLVIVLVLLIRRDALPSRSQLAARLPAVAPAVRRPELWALAVALAGLLAAVGGADTTAALTVTFASALIGLSVVVLTGYAGLLSLAQLAVAGVAALVAGRLADAGGLPFPVALAGGAAAAGLTGLVFGGIALRTRGVALAIVTLGLGVVINAVVLANPDYTGGPIEGTVVDPPQLLGLDISYVEHPSRYALTCLAVLALGLLAVRNLRAGSVGRQLLAVRANEAAAAALGVRTHATKLYAFCLASVLAGAGGVLLAFRNTSFEFNGYGVLPSNQVVLLTVLGGVGFLGGGVIAGILAAGGIVGEIVGLGAESHWYMLVVAAILVLELILFPDGVAAMLRRRPAPAKPAPEPVAGDAVAAPERKALHVRGLTVRFGGVTAVAALDLDVEPGTVVGLIGPNGAGKSTAIDAITGTTRRYDGEVKLAGEPLDSFPVYARARAGLARSFQSLELFEDMSVRDNLRVAAEVEHGGYAVTLARPTGGPLDAATARTAADLGLLDHLDAQPSSLSYAARRLLAVARAAARDPDVLLLDEPAAGLDAPDRAHLGDVIRRLADERRMGVLLVEHDVELVMRLSDRVIVLDRGRVIAAGPPEEVRREPAVIAAYLGEAHAEAVA